MGALLGITASWLTGLANILRNVEITLATHCRDSSNFSEMELSSLQSFASRSVDKITHAGRITGRILTRNSTRLALGSAGPVLGSILIVAAVEQNAAGAFILLLFYGMGVRIPMLTIAHGGRYLNQRLLSLGRHILALQRVGGVMIVAIAIVIVLGWDVQIQLWLAPFFPSLPPI